MNLSFSRDSWLALGLIILLILVTIAAAIQQARSDRLPPLTSLSSAPNGARALSLWLAELDYPVSQELVTVFQPPADTRLIFLLEPLLQITPEEWEVLDGWIEAGGTLVLAGDSWGTLLAVLHYKFELKYSAASTSPLAAQNPLWVSPPVEPVIAQARAYLSSERDDFVTHLAGDEGPVLLSFNQGEGRVFLGATAFPFSNSGLKETGNPALVLNLVSTAPQTGTIWFDEWHHGLRSDRSRIVGPTQWLRYTPAGRALLYGAIIIFVALILRGRHFGRPVPLPRDTGRRAPLEYITAIANLNRRARHRSAILDQYHHWLKRGVGQRYRLNPTLPDEEYLAQLSRFRPRLDLTALGNLLDRLRRKPVSESEMIHLANEAATWLEEK